MNGFVTSEGHSNPLGATASEKIVHENGSRPRWIQASSCIRFPWIRAFNHINPIFPFANAIIQETWEIRYCIGLVWRPSYFWIFFRRFDSTCTVDKLSKLRINQCQEMNKSTDQLKILIVVKWDSDISSFNGICACSRCAYNARSIPRAIRDCKLFRVAVSVHFWARKNMSQLTVLLTWVPSQLNVGCLDKILEFR